MRITFEKTTSYEPLTLKKKTETKESIMADRTSAGIFANLFHYLARNPDNRNLEAAKYVWTLSRDYDFHPQQMGVPESLEILNLAKKNEEGEWLYGLLAAQP
jgi:hypothetical protein